MYLSPIKCIVGSSRDQGDDGQEVRHLLARDRRRGFRLRGHLRDEKHPLPVFRRQSGRSRVEVLLKE